MRTLLALVSLASLASTAACSKSGGDDEVSDDVRATCQQAERVWVARLAARHLEYEGAEKNDIARREAVSFYRTKVQYSRFLELCHADGPPDVECLKWENRRKEKCHEAVLVMAGKFDYYQPDMSLSAWTDFTLYGLRNQPKKGQPPVKDAPPEPPAGP